MQRNCSASCFYDLLVRNRTIPLLMCLQLTFLPRTGPVGAPVVTLLLSFCLRGLRLGATKQPELRRERTEVGLHVPVFTARTAQPSHTSLLSLPFRAGLVGSRIYGIYGCGPGVTSQDFSGQVVG